MIANSPQCKLQCWLFLSCLTMSRSNLPVPAWESIKCRSLLLRSRALGIWRRNILKFLLPYNLLTLAARMTASLIEPGPRGSGAGSFPSSAFGHLSAFCISSCFMAIEFMTADKGAGRYLCNGGLYYSLVVFTLNIVDDASAGSSRLLQARHKHVILYMNNGRNCLWMIFVYITTHIWWAAPEHRPPTGKSYIYTNIAVSHWPGVHGQHCKWPINDANSELGNGFSHLLINSGPSWIARPATKWDGSHKLSLVAYNEFNNDSTTNHTRFEINWGSGYPSVLQARGILIQSWMIIYHHSCCALGVVQGCTCLWSYVSWNFIWRASGRPMLPTGGRGPRAA